MWRAGANILHCSLASGLARAARIGADPAVLMLLRVTFAFFRTSATSQRAQFECASQHRLIRARAARGKRSGAVANIRAVEIQADALLQLIGRIFGEAGIRAADASLFSLETFLDALHERFAQIAMNIGMRLDHLLRFHGRPPGE